MPKIMKCSVCNEEIAASAKICPKCGAKNKKPFYKKWWVWAIVVVIVAIVASSSGNESINTTTGEGGNGTTTVESVKKEKYEIIGDVTSEKDAFGVYIKGTLKNNSGRDCSYLQVTFNLYDKDGNQIGTALDNINNLEKDGTWKFKAMGIDSEGEVASFKLAEVTGF